MRKIFTFLAVVALIACLCVAFVACNNDDGGENSITLSADMTVDQIKEALKDITSYTVEYYTGDQKLKESKVYTVDGVSDYIANKTYVPSFSGTLQSAKFYEGNRYYDLEMGFVGDGTNGYNMVIDLSGVEFEKVNFIKENPINFDMLERVDYRIENNSIIYNYGTADIIEGEAIIKDFNKSTLRIPDDYKDNYKNLNTKFGAFSTNQISDTECILRNITFRAASITVPEKIDGKTVTKMSIGSGMPNVMTIPATIEEISVSNNAVCNKYNINYLGTKEQWNNVEKDEYAKIMCGVGQIAVECKDGQGDGYGSKIALDENMTFEQLKNALSDVNEFSVVRADVGVVYLYFENGVDTVYLSENKHTIQLFEDGYRYDLTYKSDSSLSATYVAPSDYYKVTEKTAKNQLEEVWLPRIEKGFEIKDNKIYFGTNNNEYVIGNFNSINYELPEGCANYKSVSEKKEVMELRSFGESTTGQKVYLLQRLTVALDWLIVPENYIDGGWIAGIFVDVGMVKEITIPANVEGVGVNAYPGCTTIVHYLGTREQWDALAKDVMGWQDGYCIVKCIDDKE